MRREGGRIWPILIATASGRPQSTFVLFSHLTFSLVIRLLSASFPFILYTRVFCLKRVVVDDGRGEWENDRKWPDLR